MVGATECGQETVSMSEYCEIHQPTSAREFTISIDRSIGGGRTLVQEDDFPGKSSSVTKPGGIK